LFPLRDNIPTEHFPIVTVLLIAANCFVYFFLQDGLWQLPASGGEWPVQQYAAIPCEFTGQCPAQGPPSTIVTAFTSMFMHGSLLHLGGNMLFLWIFGNNIEDSMDELRFVAFYLLGGIVALAAQVAVDPNAAVPTVGASGAIAAVLGGYAVLYPRARVITVVFIVIFFTIIELPALLVLGFWILIQLFLGANDLGSTAVGGQGGVAYFAHIGGFVFGVLMIRLFANRVHEDYERSHRLPVY
jgi:membrane associated rhomboid family serine protease